MIDVDLQMDFTQATSFHNKHQKNGIPLNYWEHQAVNLKLLKLQRKLLERNNFLQETDEVINFHSDGKMFNFQLNKHTHPIPPQHRVQILVRDQLVCVLKSTSTILLVSEFNNWINTFVGFGCELITEFIQT